MTKHTVYIIHSAQSKRYYVGYTTSTIHDRIRRHNTNHSGYTGKATDWKLVHQFSCESKEAALELERKIKGQGAKRFLERNGITHPG